MSSDASGSTNGRPTGAASAPVSTGQTSGDVPPHIAPSARPARTPVAARTTVVTGRGADSASAGSPAAPAGSAASAPSAARPVAGGPGASSATTGMVGTFTAGPPVAASVAPAAAAFPAAALVGSPAVAGGGLSKGPRRVRASITKINPWSVMKLSFLLSVALGIMLVIAVAVWWTALNKAGVFTSINDLLSEVLADSSINVLDYVAFSKVLSAATLIAVVDVFLLTLLATLTAVLYNITATLVGGIHITMTDD